MASRTGNPKPSIVDAVPNAQAQAFFEHAWFPTPVVSNDEQRMGQFSFFSEIGERAQQRVEVFVWLEIAYI